MGFGGMTMAFLHLARTPRALARLALASTVIVAATYVGAASAQPADEPEKVEKVVVTGSRIKGTPENTELPVDVITKDDLDKQGSPSIVELVKQLPVSTAALGETNQWDARASILSVGTATVNLRGLGAGRTLVLLNGQRFTPSPRTDGVDVNMFPAGAIGRIEILKEGAAAIYGSDAIAGVANFITRRDIDGVEASGSYSYIDGSDGDYTGNVSWGWVGESANLLLHVGHQHRGELPVLERDWAIRPYLENPQGGWSNYGQPGTFFGGVGAFRDPYCGTPGTFSGFTGTTPICLFQLSQYYNLVEKTDQTQIYAEANAKLSDNIELHVEALVARTDVPSLANSPSSPALQAPTSLTSSFPGFYTVPIANPAAAAFATANPSLPPFFGVYLPTFRPIGIGGNPLYDHETLQPKNRSDAWRVVGQLEGDFGEGTTWSTAVNYSGDSNLVSSRDALVNRLQAALQGLGGPGCPLTGGTPGVGPCKYFNPFSSAIRTNIITGQPNPFFDPVLAADPRIGNEDLAFMDWLTPRLDVTSTTRLLTWDADLTGDTGLQLDGGSIEWAAGLQYRRNQIEVDVDPFYDIDAFPCIDSPNGNNGCVATGQTTGPLTFYVQYRDILMTTNTYGAFAELSLPFSDNFQVQLGGRFEDHEDAGTTLNPKIAAKWQVVDWIALRGAFDTSFREPPPVVLNPTPLTSIAFLGGAFRQIRTSGNPNVDPEEAESFNVGAILEPGNLVATVDYWKVDFQKPIGVEPFGAMFDTMFPAVGPNRCGDPAYAQLQARMTFALDTCSLANLRSININFTNGSGVETSGIDFAAQYTIPDVWSGTFNIGADFAYVLEYNVGATTVAGVPNIQPAFDAVGQLNYGSSAFPLPQWKGNGFLEFATGDHNFRVTAHYVDGYLDERTAIYVAPVNSNAGPGGPGTGTGAFNAANNVVVTNGKFIDSTLTFDFVYRVELPWESTATFAVFNVLDEDPSTARLDLNYDPFTGNPVGRVLKVGLSKKF